ncbi:unnamed protein product [Owenia fusiformis]|uniref:Uncharacterized protein n=1 Tax=Owenia fusiformis TaxID=6347 RepID=A0A8S4N6C7_OWEFU|nr:unnamed protein product [Owenia fusiformis]
MTTSLLQGKTFYCREWAFSKLQHCLESRPTSKTCGALIMGGPGCGKTALCCQTVWPTVSVGKQIALSARILGYHFCQAHDIETLSITNFVHSIVDQLCTSSKLNEYEDILKERGLLDALDPLQCEKDPDTAFIQTVLEPLEAIEPPDRNLIILVDSIDESYLQSISERTTGSRTIAELLANHHHLFPKWLLLVCSARKGSKAITRMFTGFRKISLDDLHKTHVVRDVQQYILCRLDREEKLRQHLSRDTAEMLNQLHIKSNGCFLYLEKVLDGVSDNFIMLREIKEIPGTLNGLYLWLCQRLFVRKQFAKIQPILNVILAARRPLTEMELYTCCWTRNIKLTIEEFSKRIDILSKVLLEGPNKTKILFHHSFAEWILDVKHCTQKYLCTASEGHSMLAMSFTLHAENLAAVEVQDFALHLSKSTAVNHLEAFQLALWLIESGANVHDSLSVGMPKEQHVVKLLLDAGAALPDPDGPNSVHCSREDLLAEVEESCMLPPEPQQIDSNGMTDLANAAHSGNLTVLLDLLNTNVDLESQDKQGQTPINLAARQGHIEIVAALLNAGVNVNHTDNDGWSPLRSAAWGGHTEVVSLLLSAGADVDHADTDLRTALRAAAWGGHEDIVIKLLEHGANVNKTDNEGRTALIAGAYMGHCEIVEHLLDNSANINHQDCDGRTALSVAALCLPASKGHSSVISLLLDRGADVNHRDNDGMTPLLVAAYEGQYQVRINLKKEGLIFRYSFQKCYLIFNTLTQAFI